MQGYSDGILGPLITVHYNEYVEASMQGYIKGSEGDFMTSIIKAK
jgi:hypothetical protein